ncbi:hypothetical protein [Caproiciproducens sp. CPB-2]|uniref:hypothetical protein n=1 Tax=Caproiciproducens sp. CPB-2 TaxID=3030017 RepID=UPI0023D9ABCA|nr:hypothetical protein [Caproiciproducens sp. CPB-2]MDF1495207.1 hypothetical protein [Caproiciproducens sp. CPB-2]
MDSLTNAIIIVNLLPSNYSLRTNEEKAVDKVVKAAVAFNVTNRRAVPENVRNLLETVHDLRNENTRLRTEIERKKNAAPENNDAELYLNAYKDLLEKSIELNKKLLKEKAESNKPSA